MTLHFEKSQNFKKNIIGWPIFPSTQKWKWVRLTHNIMKLHDKHYFLSCVDVFPFAFDSNSPWQVVLGEGHSLSRELLIGLKISVMHDESSMWYPEWKGYKLEIYIFAYKWSLTMVWSALAYDLKADSSFDFMVLMPRFIVWVWSSNALKASFSYFLVVICADTN